MLDGGEGMSRREEAYPTEAAMTAAEWRVCQAALRLIAAQFNSAGFHKAQESRARSDLNQAIKQLKEAQEERGKEFDRQRAEDAKTHGLSVAAALATLNEKAGKKLTSVKARRPRL